MRPLLLSYNKTVAELSQPAVGSSSAIPSTLSNSLMFHSPFSALVTLASVGVANAWFRVRMHGPARSRAVGLTPSYRPAEARPSTSIPSTAPPVEILPPSLIAALLILFLYDIDFNPTYSFENLRASNCTNCLVTQLYFQDPKTKLFEPVANGGLLVYYQNRGDGDKSNGGPGIKAFPPGLRMIAGDPKRRSKKFAVGLGTQEELRERAVQWSCLRFLPQACLAMVYDNGTGFPTTNCESGLNSRLHMPACWDGVNLDSADHVSHMAYLSGLDNGSCPSGFIYMMKLFFEITWNVNDFTARWTPGDGQVAVVYATGDPTGFSWHGDFPKRVRAKSFLPWDVTALQNAIDNCNNPNDDTGSGVTEACRFLTVKSAALANTCKIAPIVKEVINGTLAKLPGCNPLQFGPQDATIFNDANCPAT
ncbi:hypothetical protein B0H14DRAFT_3718198 [Mycena olivaceomarginata]|nr:hypothetical protein B0H14DRAFT_3718198 [Mycena olivaceomarginata]